MGLGVTKPCHAEEFLGSSRNPSSSPLCVLSLLNFLVFFGMRTLLAISYYSWLKSRRSYSSLFHNLLSPVSLLLLCRHRSIIQIYPTTAVMSEALKPVVFCGPSGVGKGTLIELLMKRFPNDQFGFSVSHTTRQPREGEEDGKHYNFITIEAIKEDIANGKFIEYAEVHGKYYGTRYVTYDVTCVHKQTHTHTSSLSVVVVPPGVCVRKCTRPLFSHDIYVFPFPGCFSMTLFYATHTHTIYYTF